ncbi:MAG: hypothetical protein V1848_01240 [Candidatus Magasanikbacteria bacterium]
MYIFSNAVTRIFGTRSFVTGETPHADGIVEIQVIPGEFKQYPIVVIPFDEIFHTFGEDARITVSMHVKGFWKKHYFLTIRISGVKFPPLPA